MKITVKTERDYHTLAWSGGTTTELYLYPEDGSYAKRQFQVRISSATVDLEESTFTSLPGTTRYLAAVTGELYLCHKGRYERRMQPYEIEKFQGDWETTSRGRVRDFNLMLKDGADGEMTAVLINAGETVKLSFYNKETQWDHAVIFNPEGTFCIQDISLNPFQCAALEGLGPDSEALVTNKGAKAAHLLICKFRIAGA